MRLALSARMRDPQVTALMAALGGAADEARFVGGCVRDAVLGRESHDLDVATRHPPDRAMALLAGAAFRVIPTGIRHGTVTALAGAQPVEVTTLRRDVETDGRHAVVAYTDDWTADAARRDFTINALSLGMDGILRDPFGGGADLRAGRVRFVGAPARRIAEDRLRILRFFRFFAWFGTGPPDRDGLAACAAAAGTVLRLAGERIGHELRRLLTAPDPAPALAAMDDAGVWQTLFGSPPDRAALAQLLALEPGPPDPLLRLAAACRAPADALAVRLRLTRQEHRRLRDLAAPRTGLAAPAESRRAGLYRLGPARFRDHLLLDAARRAPADRAAVAAALAEAAAWTAPVLPIGGRDLAALGQPPGPATGRLLRAVEAWWIAGGFRAGRAACLDRARTLLAAPPGGGDRPGRY